MFAGGVFGVYVLGFLFFIYQRKTTVQATEVHKLAALDRSMGTIEFTLDGRVITANANFLSVLGYTLDEAKGVHHRTFVHKDYADSAEYRAFWETLRRGEFISGEFQRVGKGGRDIWLQASYNPLLDARGKPYKVVKFTSDITPQVRLRLQNQRIKDTITENVGTVSASVAETQGIVEGVAKGVSELTTSVQDIAKSMQVSQGAVAQVVTQTDDANHAVTELSRASESMNSVVELIQGIASQISLLALNAAIEAARAGDAGRGFAVVSDEVKKLAAQTTTATADIGGEILKMQDIAKRVVTSLGQITSSIASVSDNVGAVAAATEQQSSVATQIARSMSEVDIAVSSINGSIMDIQRTILE